MSPPVSSRRQLTLGVLLGVALMVAVTAVPIAEQRALAAEDEYVTAQLGDASCLTDRGTREGAATQYTEATGISAEGIRVEVSLAYAYTTEQDGETIYADSASEAVYDVTPLGAHRVRGDDISPC